LRLLGAVRDADQIVVLGRGAIIEQGSHRELLEADGEYARLFRLQAGGYRDESDDDPVTAPHQQGVDRWHRGRNRLLDDGAANAVCRGCGRGRKHGAGPALR
jgi:hypothetical protein